jgi:Putative Actinobacterial Holin-X, holin superfamily III
MPESTGSEPPGTGTSPRRRRTEGIAASARRVVAHLSTLARLERELLQAELGRKGAVVGSGLGVGAAAALLVPYAVGFGLATATAALALVVDVWLALLIMFVALLLLVAILALVARNLVRKGTPITPEQALEEARLTRAALRGSNAR